MRVFGHFVLTSRVRLFLAEQAAIGVLFLAAAASGGIAGAPALLLSFGAVISLQAAMYLADLYQPGERLPEARWMIASGLGVMGASLIWARTGASWPGLWLLACGIATMLLPVLRGLALARPRRAIVLGTGPMARAVGSLREAVVDCQIMGYVPEGLLGGSASDDTPVPAELPLLLSRGDVDRLAHRMKADLLVVATETALPEESLARARACGVDVVSAAGFASRFGRRLPPELLGKSELIFGEGFGATTFSDVVQRVLDVIVAVVLLVLSSPVLLLAAIAIKIDSPGPVFYSQERVGRRGRTYQVSKLRSMRADAESTGTPQWAQQSDPRVTRVGAFLRRARIDEIPQVFSVLRGHMSMVGPRPERPYFVEQLKTQIPLYGLREVVKPGVTGWAQICYRYGATVEDARKKLEYDLYYIRHRSFFLNLSILFHTARTVIMGRGAR